MSLPVFKDPNSNLMFVQTTWKKEIDPVLANPLTQGLLLQRVSLITGTNSINHLLGRRLQGWNIVRQRGAASVYDSQDINQMPTLTLQLVASAPVIVDLYVF